MPEENKIEVLMTIVNQMSSQLGAISADFSKFKVSTEQNGKQIAQSMNTSVKSFLGFVGLPVTIAAVGVAIWKLSKETMAYGKTVKDLAYTMDVTTEQAQLLKRMATILNVDIGVLESSFFTLSTKLEDLRQGTTDAIVKFDRFGISTEAIRDGSVSLFEAFTKIVDYLGKMENPTQRNALAVDLLGKSGKKLSDVFNEAGGNFAEYLQTVKKGVKILSEEEIKSLDETAKAYSKFWDDRMNEWRKFFVLITSDQAIKNTANFYLEKEVNDAFLMAKGDMVVLRRRFLELQQEWKNTPGMVAAFQTQIDELSKKPETAKPKSKTQEKSDKEKVQEIVNALKDKLSKAEFEAGGNTDVLRRKLELLKEEYKGNADAIKDLDAKLGDLTKSDYGKKFDESWTAAMNHMRDASIDWAKTLIKIVDDIRDSFSDAFYSIGEMLVAHTGSWKQTLRSFYQSVTGSIGRGLSDALGTTVTSLFAQEQKDKTGKVIEKGGALSGVTSAIPYLAAIAAAVTLVSSPAQRHKEEMDRWKEKKEVNRQIEDEKAKIWAKRYAEEMQKAGLTAQSVSGGLGTGPVKASETPEQVSLAARTARAVQLQTDTINAAHAQYKHSKSRSALNYYYDLLDNPFQWWLDQV